MRINVLSKRNKEKKNDMIENIAALKNLQQQLWLLWDINKCIWVYNIEILISQGKENVEILILFDNLREMGQQPEEFQHKQAGFDDELLSFCFCSTVYHYKKDAHIAFPPRSYVRMAATVWSFFLFGNSPTPVRPTSTLASPSCNGPIEKQGI
jgi:hypothetical protein